MKPFLKWAGGKHRLVDRIKALMPEGGRLIEPFVGSGAVFLSTQYDRFLLADANLDLINTYRYLQREGSDFVAACRSLFVSENNTPEGYYQLRERFNRSGSVEERAMLFVYLNKHGYNGLCRYNSSGGFNVPFGRYSRPHFPGEEMLSFWRKVQRAEFTHRDFIETMRSAESGDVIYCDPPYVPLSATASFTAYSAGGFSTAAQVKLAETAHELAERGIPVIISNHDTALTRQLYAGARRIEAFAVQRNISCNPAKRETARELLALFGPPTMIFAQPTFPEFA